MDTDADDATGVQTQTALSHYFLYLYVCGWGRRLALSSIATISEPIKKPHIKKIWM